LISVRLFTEKNVVRRRTGNNVKIDGLVGKEGKVRSLIRNTISSNLLFLVFIVITPAICILMFTGIEQKQHAIEEAEEDLLIISLAMSEVQKSVAQSTKQLLSALAIYHEVKKADLQQSHQIFNRILERNPIYQNIALTDAQGNVISSGLTPPSKSTRPRSLADRRHVQLALESGKFSAGEYMMSRIDITEHSFAFAQPVMDGSGRLAGVVTVAIRPPSLSHLYDLSSLPPNSFIAITDRKGIRVFYYPSKITNPVGKPIQAASWNHVKGARKPGTFKTIGSDGVTRLVTYSPVSLRADDPPYMYVWVGTPYEQILTPATKALTRNIILMFLVTMMAITFWWVIGRHRFVTPIQRLVRLTQTFATGNLTERIRLHREPKEIIDLNDSINTMAQSLYDKQVELAEERERLVVTLKSIGDGVIATDIQGRVTLLNAVAEELTGWKNHQARGRSLEDIFHVFKKGDVTPYLNPIHRILQGSHSIIEENGTILQAKDGSRYNIAINAAPIKDIESEVIGGVLVFRDITEQLKAEQEVIKGKKLESLGVLAGGIAHDFNNILAGILGNIDLALALSGPEDKTKKLLQDAVSASMRAQGLTQQLLTFSKGGQPIKQKTSLVEVVTDSCDFIVRGSNVVCSYSCPEDLWLVEIDKNQVSQVVQNIALNAKQAMDQGGIIRLSFENSATDNGHLPKDLSPGKYVKLCIADTGRGIEPERVERIFDPYYTTRDGGSGLGLAICHSIVKKHNGSITVSSKINSGTTFTIYLPASEESADVVPGNSNLDRGWDNTKNARILIMDDEEVVRESTSEMLIALGYDVLLAENGDQALAIYQDQLVKKEPVDVVIMDLTIAGGKGGKETVTELLAIDPHAKVIVSSGYSQDPVMAQFKDYGFCAKLDKPCRLKFLSETVEQVLRGT